MYPSKHRHQRLDQMACIDCGRFRLTRIEKIGKIKHRDTFAVKNKIPLEAEILQNHQPHQ